LRRNAAPARTGATANSRNQEVVMATLHVPTDRRHIPERRTAAGAEPGSSLSVMDYIAMALLIIGGLNWAMVALFGIDVVATLFGVLSPATRLVYLLVGIAALYAIYLTSRMSSSRH
jgi:uncharacterized membrane protein YuzA (DUF378 family)